MKLFSNDFFLWLKLAIGVIKLIAQIFGDDEDQANADKNGFS